MEEGYQVRNARLTTFWEEKRVILICFFIGFAQFQYGYDSAAVAGFQSMAGFLRIFGYPDPEITIGYNITTKVQRLIQSLMNLGGLTASIGIYALGPRASRRVGLWIACAIGVIAISIQIGPTTLGALYAGRFLLGISNGFFMVFCVTYMSEIAPAHLRGSVVGLVTFHTSFGALIGILIENYTSTSLARKSYQIPLAIMYVVPICMAIILLFLPDTPRYYISRGKHDSAVASIRKTRGINDMDRILAEVADIQNTWDQEQELHKDARIMDMFRGCDLRRTLITFGCAVGQTATGVTFLAGYSVYFYVQARIGSPFVWVMAGLAIALSGNLAAFPAMRFFGRRPLLIGCSIWSSIMMFGMAIVYTKAANGSPNAGKALVAFSIIFTWTYGLGQGPVLWAITSEIPSQRLRSQTVGIANGINFIFGWLVAFCTPYFINPTSLNWGPKYGYIWGASNLILAVWVFFFIPETKGRSLEQLDELFEKRVPTWKFASYKTEHHIVDADKVFEDPSGGEAKVCEKSFVVYARAVQSSLSYRQFPTVMITSIPNIG
ncbi:general substrate transporter [Mollisia scopiformis]|uniref:General substrate transporter n=1 Tax=Mollisia scopiformis TaxID=149040 RepID=A0A194XFZ7_MOLSC|nr:general substrate transporter [Mollisia scopiformis]KUJ18697.1 general substrate transporter [Mollisia scopiformis]